MMDLSPQEKAKVLIEALPYIKKFHGKTLVIKYGGKAMVDDNLRKSVISDIALLYLVGMKVILVHGGGPQINSYLERLGMKPAYKDGVRITDRETMEVVRMVLTGIINKDLVGLLNSHGITALGLSGEDAKLLKARKISEELGLVGEVEEVNSGILSEIIGDGAIPVIATVGIDGNNQPLNINADEAATKIAGSLQADKLIFMTDVDGVIVDGKLKSKLSTFEAEELIKEGKAGGGMVPKLRASVSAVKSGVRSVHILNGTVKHALLLEIFTDSGIGTMVSAD